VVNGNVQHPLQWKVSGYLIIALLCVRAVILGGINSLRCAFSQQAFQNRQWFSLTDHQPAAAAAQFFIQQAQTGQQKSLPPRRGFFPQQRVYDKNRQNNRVPVQGGAQRGIIAKPQVTPDPPDGQRHFSFLRTRVYNIVMTQSNTFDVLILIARPAAGKSEIIHFLKNTPLEHRGDRFHIGKIDEIDDFPMLWTWFEEDDILSQMGKPRLHTTEDGYFRWSYLWDVLIRRISLEHQKRLRDNPSRSEPVTTLVEFARGVEHGGFRRAFEHLSTDLLKRAAILYINVSYAESLRKNRKRFNPNRPDSILEHGLSDEKMERLYGQVDWQELSQSETSGFLSIQGIQVPFVVFENEDDVTTPGGEALGSRLKTALDDLWKRYIERQGP
jgi:hypothetical protein